MTISKKMADALNEQVKNELYSANLYLSMAIDFDEGGLSGFADFYYAQAKEEEMHGQKIIKYLLDVGGRPVVPEIPKPPEKFEGGIDILKKSLEHEKKVTGMIRNLVKISRDEDDYPTENFLQWYVSEQVEEEASFSEILSLAEKAGEDNLFLIQAQLKRSEGGRESGE